MSCGNVLQITPPGYSQSNDVVSDPNITCGIGGGTPKPVKYGDNIIIHDNGGDQSVAAFWSTDSSSGNECYLHVYTDPATEANAMVMTILSTDPSLAIGDTVNDGAPVYIIAYPQPSQNSEMVKNCNETGDCNWWYLTQFSSAGVPKWYNGSTTPAGDGDGVWYIREVSATNEDNADNPPSQGIGTPIYYGDGVYIGSPKLYWDYGDDYYLRATEDVLGGSGDIGYTSYSAGGPFGGPGSVLQILNPQGVVPCGASATSACASSASSTTPSSATPASSASSTSSATPASSASSTSWTCDTTCTIQNGAAVCNYPTETPIYNSTTCSATCIGGGITENSPAPPSTSTASSSDNKDVYIVIGVTAGLAVLVLIILIIVLAKKK